MKRTVEKACAWIGNIFLMIAIGVMGYVQFTDKVKSLATNEDFRKALLRSAEENNATIDIDKTVIVMQAGLMLYLIVCVVCLILALIATFLMKKRVASGILFVLSALGIALFTVGAGFIVYVPYFVAGIMLFVRKEKVKIDKQYY